MEKAVISDTSCIILLDKIGELDLLKKLFGKIIITKKIEEEYGRQIPKWFEVKNPLESTYEKIINLNIDRGEAGAIALSIELEDSLLIIDDLKGRKIVESLGIKFMGTLGIILRAKKQNIIPSVIQIIEKIKQTNFRLTEMLERKVYRDSGELS